MRSGNTKSQFIAKLLAAGLLVAACGPATAAISIEGQVQVGGGPLASSTVTLWAASAGQPRQLAQARTNNDGQFELGSQETPGADTLYLVAKGGIPAVNKAAGDNPAIALLSVLGDAPPSKVVVNEMTTVASTFTSARFIEGEAISGNPLGLRIAAGNAPNLVDPTTGGWGKVLLDPLNSSMTTTLAKLDTLGSLISAYATVANDDWRARFLKAATPTGGRVMTAKNFSILAAVIFGIVAVLQFARAISEAPINVGTTISIPVWASWIACIVAAVLAWLGFSASRS
jgi:hypothetical protein